MKISIQYHPLKFIRPAGTSRGIMTVKQCWIVRIERNGIQGIGEVSIIEGLSKEFTEVEEFEAQLEQFCKKLESLAPSFNTLKFVLPEIIQYPSILLAFESALLDLENGGKQCYYQNNFTSGKLGIPINGLIWMGDEKSMQQQIEEKLATGYSTIKMKIGAIDLATELRLLASIRKKYDRNKITLRVDANGAFEFEQAKIVLAQLAALHIHSIEQPVAAGNWQQMKELCQHTPIPIALDEELIGITDYLDKIALLETIEPQFIILKPSLHGGISGVREWISLAEERNIKWWMTSALESNIGLSMIAQLAAEYANELPQGLGTGSLYSNNFESNLQIKNGQLFSVPIS
ncbi:MAG: o-succinylbenzoate synthase [Bacteroidota bacterium]